ncbi:hypothetical protein [Stenotrophomonas maltophilia]|uniref:hypothetical protein n=1 Tax=Stenotrophomonas maltophilia TaxID=40324 RepID=UPI0012FD5EC2|nr:hypothetical protein [Stenotrophomonas maltophilia]MBN5011511.1 hypothetical protein [Stenotrophomonas maltophilia]HEL4148296.1 hypothetical protein [Stenotrophomonas maltophilia]
MTSNEADVGLKVASLENVVAALQADIATIKGELQLLRSTNDMFAHTVRGVEAKLDGRN